MVSVPTRARAVLVRRRGCRGGLALTACGSSGAPVSSSAPVAAPVHVRHPVMTYPLTITQCGRTLTFDKAPTRVVVDGEKPRRCCSEIGAGDRSALFTRASGAHPDSVVPFGRGCPAARALLPRRHGRQLLPRRRRSLAAAPDLVIEASRRGSLERATARHRRPRLWHRLHVVAELLRASLEPN